MKVGDLVVFDVDSNRLGPNCPGALTAVKYYARMNKECAGKTGVIIKFSGNNAAVMFESNLYVIHKEFLKVISDEAS